MRRIATILLWIAAGWSIAAPAIAGPGRSGPERSAPERSAPLRAAIDRPLRTCVLRDSGDVTAAALFAAPGRFDCVHGQKAYGAGDFWVLSQPLPPLPDHPVLRQGGMWQDRTTLYVRYADGAIRRTGFTSRSAGRLLQLGAIIQTPLPPHGSRAVRLLWHIEGATNRRGLVVGPVITDAATAAQRETQMAALYAAFAGLCIALLIYNLALWAALRQAYQPIYCLMVMFMLAYAFTSSGLLGRWTTIDNNDRQRLSYLLLGCVTVTTILFVRSFLERRIFDGWLRKASNGIIAFLLVVITSYTILTPHLVNVTDALNTVAYSLVIALAVPVVWRAWRLRSRFLWVFALAWGAPVICGAVRILATLDIMSWRLWIDNSTLIALAIEASLSSVGIAYRIRLLSIERDAARAQEVAALRLAATDPLTGLLNRRAFLETAIGRDDEQQLVLIDIDHFKAVNETIGHDGGDEVLRVIARALRAGATPLSLIARLGGEEFAILTPAAAALDARHVLDALRAQRMPFDLAVTASIGTCIGPMTREIDWKALYRCADRALFEAKAAGRDRVRHGDTIAAAA